MTKKVKEQMSIYNVRSVEPTVSIIVNNYNYARFLQKALDSALGQRYPRTEVIVVDDGSTDDSRQVIASYGSRVRGVFKSNGGQASALNAGFQASHGEIVLFLDADDILFPNAVANLVPRLQEAGVSKVHWPMWLIDSQGQRLGGTRPAHVPPEGDFRAQVLERGPSNVASSPTSGNAWARSFLERVMPIPENLAYYRSCADEYLYLLAPVFGRVRTLPEPQGCYRIHSHNIYSSRSFRQKLDMELGGYDEQCIALTGALARNGITADISSWQQHSWFHRLDQAIADVLSVVPEGAELILIDGGTWGLAGDFEGRVVRPFLERDGADWGEPANDHQAIEALRCAADGRTQFLVIAWSNFWWLDQYPIFYAQLEQTADCVRRSDAVLIYDLQKQPTLACRSYPIRLVHKDRHDA